MKVLFVVSALIVVAHSSPLLGSKKCTWGPSYWCSSLDAANECNTLQHCQENVWKQKAPPAAIAMDDNVPVGAGGCTLCEFMIKEAEKMVENNATEEKLLSFLEQACRIIPNSGLQEECKNAIDQYGPAIIDMIINMADPKTVCAFIGMCATETQMTPKEMVHKIERNVKAGLCDDCKSAIQFVENLVENNSTEKEIEDFLENNLCKILGGLEDLCKQVVKSYLPKIIELIENKEDPNTVCAQIGFCSAEIKNQLKKKMEAAVKPQVGDACSDCQDAVKELVDFVQKNSSEAEIEKFLNETLCDQLGPIADLCKQVVMAYVPEIIELVKNDVDPNEVCSLIGFCSAQVEELKRSREALLKNDECLICEFVVREVENFLQKNSSQDDVAKVLDNLCDVLPVETGECKSFINEYTQAIVTLLVNEFDPKTTCKFLRVCSATENIGVTSCDVCRFAVTYLDDLLKENKTEADIDAALLKVCKYLPSSLKTECDAIIKQYGPAIVELLAQLVDPDMICQKLGLCQSSYKHDGVVKPLQGH